MQELIKYITKISFRQGNWLVFSFLLIDIPILFIWKKYFDYQTILLFRFCFYFSNITDYSPIQIKALFGLYPIKAGKLAISIYAYLFLICLCFSFLRMVICFVLKIDLHYGHELLNFLSVLSLFIIIGGFFQFLDLSEIKYNWLKKLIIISGFNLCILLENSFFIFVLNSNYFLRLFLIFIALAFWYQQIKKQNQLCNFYFND